MSGSRSSHWLHTRYRVFLAASVFAILGLALLLVAQELVEHPTLQELSRALGTFSMATVAVTFLWEYMTRRWLLEEIKDLARLSDLMNDVGLLNVQFSEEDIVQVSGPPRGTTIKDLDILLGCDDKGHLHWHDQKAVQKLLRHASDDGAQVRVLIPDPDASYVARAVAERLGTEWDRAAEEVQLPLSTLASGLESRWSDSGRDAANGADGFSLRVGQIREVPRFSYLRVNDQATVIPCRYRSESSTSVPVLWVGGGKSLFEFFSTEFDRMWNDAHAVDGNGGPGRDSGS